MAVTSYVVWLAAADAPVFVQAYPHATFIRNDRVEPGIVVYAVSLDVVPSSTTFPLVDGVFWDSVWGGHKDADGVTREVPYLFTHAHARAAAPPPPPPPPGENTQKKLKNKKYTKEKKTKIENKTKN